ncbi:MAG: hypothetical protein LBN34_08840 [Clostridiales Family XIII bacterium]|nr:hypothetical protein [Clostridiales Family XIII bacterium]
MTELNYEVRAQNRRKRIVRRKRATSIILIIALMSLAIMPIASWGDSKAQSGESFTASFEGEDRGEAPIDEELEPTEEPSMEALAAGADVSDRIDITDLVVKVDGITVYTHPDKVNPIDKIAANAILSFNLNWEVRNPRDEANKFHDGDYFEIKVLTSSDVTLFGGKKIKLNIDDVYVADGVFSAVDGIIKFRVTFNENAQSKIIFSGKASGWAQYMISDTNNPVKLWFEDSTSVDLTIPEVDDSENTPGGDEEDGDIYPYPDEPNGPNPPPEGLLKGIVNNVTAPGQGNVLKDSKSNTPAKAIPDLTGYEYHGYTWFAPFFGLQEHFEQAPDSDSSSDVIIEETISGNLKFSNYDNMNGEWIGDTEDPNTNYTDFRGDSESFFAIELPFKAFSYNHGGKYGQTGWSYDLTENSQGMPYSNAFIVQREMKQYYFDGDYVYPSNVKGEKIERDGGGEADVQKLEAAVRGTPFSWATTDIVDEDGDERHKLIINAGAFGAGSPISFERTMGQTKPFEDVANTYLEQALLAQLNFDLYNGRNSHTPYANIMNELSRLNEGLLDLDIDSNEAAYAELKRLNFALTGAESGKGTAKDSYLLGGDMKDFAFWEEGHWLPADAYFYTETLNQDKLPNLSKFIKNKGGSNSQWEDKPIKQLAGKLQVNLFNYNTTMKALTNVSANEKARDEYLKSLLFYFPTFKDYFGEKLSITGYNSLSTDEFISEMAQRTAIKWDTDPDLVSNKGNAAGKWLEQIVADLGGMNIGYEGADAKEDKLKFLFREFHTSALNLVYRSILYDESNPIIENQIKVSSGFDEWNSEKDYQHQYEASITGEAEKERDDDKGKDKPSPVPGQIISVEVDKDTIRRTSAAFDESLMDSADYRNVGDPNERYKYEIDFRSTSNVDTDEFVVDDSLEAVKQGLIRMEEFWTPVTWGDIDGHYFVLYRTNKTKSKSDPGVDSNEEKAEKDELYPNKGYELWPIEGADEHGISTEKRYHLLVSDLNLDEGEYITGLRFDFGAVKVGFTSKNYSDYSLNGEQRDEFGLNALFAGITTDGFVNWTPDSKSGFYSEDAAKAVGLRPAAYLVSATRAMTGTDIVSSATARIALLAAKDADQDVVITKEIETFDTSPLVFDVQTDAEEITFEDSLVPLGNRTLGAPTTGDPMKIGSIILAMAAAIFIIIFSICLRIGKVKRRRATMEVKIGE